MEVEDHRIYFCVSRHGSHYNMAAITSIHVRICLWKLTGPIAVLHKPSASQVTLFDCIKLLTDVLYCVCIWISTAIDDVWRLKIIVIDYICV